MIDYSNRITPENIQELNYFEIFVFGSNIKGVHVLGAAKQALKFGAKYGQSYGMQGRTFAIPTKDHKIKTMSISEIVPYVKLFIDFAMNNEEYKFLVTKIGCGLAGYKVEDIAPLFMYAFNVKNIHLPLEFWKVIENIVGDNGDLI